MHSFLNPSCIWFCIRASVLALLLVQAGPSSAAEAISICELPLKMPRGTGGSSYSPRVCLDYSGLRNGERYTLRVWLLSVPSFNCASSDSWCEEEFELDNRNGSRSSGNLQVILPMDVHDYPRFDWVFRLYDSSGTQVAFTERFIESTANRAPIISPVSALNGFVGTTIASTFAVTDPNGDAVSVIAEELPPGASFDSSTKRFLWVPKSAGTFKFILKATDNGDGLLSDYARVTIEVAAAVQQPPVVTIGPSHSGFEDQVLVIPFSISDPDTSVAALTVSTDSLNKSLFPNGSVVLGGSGSNRSMTVSPAADQSGIGTISVSVSDGSKSTSVSTAIAIHPVNDPPTLDAISPRLLLEDSPVQTFSLTGIGSGAANEVQPLTVKVVSDNPGLIPHPVVNYLSPAALGSFNILPVPNRSGTATLTVTVADDSPSNNIVTRTLPITVRAVNDAPTFVRGPDQRVTAGAGARVVSGWASAISAGPPDESAQSVVFEVGVSNPVLFVAPPEILPDGTLKFTPSQVATGTALVSVRVKDSGGTSDGGVNVSPTQTFSITVEQAEPPKLEITSVPPFGSFDNIRGRATGVNPAEFKVATCIFLSGQGWFSKPTCGSPLVSVGADGGFEVDITTGGIDERAEIIAAFLVPASFAIDCVLGAECLPDKLLQSSVASVTARRANASARAVEFSGLKWYVKDGGTAKLGPGPNYFAGGTENVSLDAFGRLRLRLTNRGGRWQCAEVYAEKSFGRGTFVFELESIASLDPNVVLGIFTWSDDCPHNEIDIEFSKWGDGNNPNNAQYVVQPFGLTGHLNRFQLPASGGASTHSFRWASDRVHFRSWQGPVGNRFDPEKQLADWTFMKSSAVPVPSTETPRFNLWLVDGIAPSNNQEVEVVIRSFRFYPEETVAPVVQIASPLDGANIPSNTVLVRGSVQDNGIVSSGVVHVEARVNQGPWIKANGLGEWVVPMPLSSGTNAIEVRAMDGAGNVSALAQRYVVASQIVDTTSPKVAIRTPVDGATTTVAVVVVTGTAADESGVGASGLARVQVRLNEGSWFDVTGTSSWSQEVTLLLGGNSIEVRAIDKAGNMSDTVRRTVTLTQVRDTVPPVIQILSPADKAMFPKGTITIAGVASDPTGPGSGLDRTEISVDGGAWQKADGLTNWTLRATLDAAAHSIQARAYDKSGNVSQIAAVLITVVHPQLGDLTGDKWNDLLFQDAGGAFGIWSLNAQGTAASFASLIPARVSDSSWRSVGLGDFDANGQLDLLFQHRTGSVGLWFLDGVRFIRTTLTTPANPGDVRWRIAAVADLDGDGRSEIVWQHGEGTLAAWFMNGSELKSSVVIKPDRPQNTAWDLVAAGRFDENGTDDLLFQSRQGALMIWMMKGETAEKQEVVTPSNPGGGWRVRGALDINLDGKCDIVFAHPEGPLAAWYMDGTKLVRARYLEPSVPAPGWSLTGRWNVNEPEKP